MTKDDFSDQLLMRFVDGEVDDAAAERIETAMRNDAGLADRVAVFAETRALAKDALAPLLNEPVPAALARSVESMIEQHRRGQRPLAEPENVVSLSSRRMQRSLLQQWAIPLAASIAVIVAGIGGFWLGEHDSSQQQELALGTIDNPAVVNALATVASGSEIQIPALGQMRFVSSFRGGKDEFCRELELTPSKGRTQSLVACHKQDAWATTFAVVIPANDDSYAPASSDTALDSYLASIEASPPMSTAQEKQALNGLAHRAF
jgi:hypothetical protein